MNNSTGKKVLKTAFMVMCITMVGKGLGLVCDIVFASTYGAGRMMDAFYLALILPQMFHSWIIQPVRISFIPIFMEKLEDKGEKGAWAVANMINSNFLLIALFGTGILIFMSPTLISMLAPGFDAQLKDLSTTIARFIMVLFFLNILNDLLVNISYGYRRFALPAMRPAINNVTIILTVVLFYKSLGIYALVLGILLGAVGKVIIMLPMIWSNRSLVSLNINFRNSTMKKMSLLGIPIAVGMFGAKMDTIVDRFFASQLIEGSVSALAYASRIITIPNEIFLMSFSLVLFPFFCEAAGKMQFSEIGDTLFDSLKLSFSILLPASLGLAILAVPVVRILFQRGAFDEWAVENTSRALFFLSLGLAPLSANLLMMPAFYSLQRNKTPIAIGLVRVAAKIGLTILLVQPFGLAGLALASSLSQIMKLVMLLVFLPSHLWKNHHRAAFHSFAKTIVSTLVMGGCVYYCYALLEGALQFHPAILCLTIKLLASVSVGVISYFAVSFFIRHPEIILITRTIQRKGLKTLLKFRITLNGHENHIAKDQSIE